MWPWNRDARRRQPLAEPFPSHWQTFVEQNIAHDRLLSDPERERLRNLTCGFIAQKFWEGCAGLDITAEIQVTIAAQACLMLLGLEQDCFRRVRSILVYPSSFRVPDPDGHEEASDWIFSGQAMPQGPVLLSWDQVLAEGRDPSLGRNVVIHEFAHQLDFLDGYHDGTLNWAGEVAERWTKVLSTAYRQLRRRVREGRRTFLGSYASTSKTEFFAVASERFFTRPLEFQRYQPELYAMLVAAYRVDPGRWFRGNDGS